jgi:hypothetical protein
VHVVELVWRDQVPDRTQCVDPFAQPFVGFGGGPQEEFPAGEPNDDRAGRERHGADREGHLDDGTVDDPEVLADRL